MTIEKDLVRANGGIVAPQYLRDDETAFEPLKGSNGAINVNVNGSLANVCNVLNVTTAGTRVQLPNIPCREITIIAKRTVTGYIYVGDSLVSNLRYGVELASKEAFTFAVTNANQVWIDASVSGEGISYVAI